jgi:SPP1 gp7 family putative phage head morphogenesis protein
MNLWKFILSFFTHKDTESKSHQKESFIANSMVIGEGVRKELDGLHGQRSLELMYVNWPASEISTLLTPDIIRFVFYESLYHAKLNKHIQNELQERYSNLTEEEARIIVRSVASKANSVFGRVRAEKIGVKWYQWSTSRDKRVRPSHRKLEGVLIPWKYPPSPEELIGKPFIGHYHAGEGTECRCCALAIVDLSDIKFPRRVYWQGKIQVMKKSDFAKIFD